MDYSGILAVNCKYIKYFERFIDKLIYTPII